MKEIYVKPTVSCKSMTVESRFLVGSPIVYLESAKSVQINEQEGKTGEGGYENPFEIDPWE